MNLFFIGRVLAVYILFCCYSVHAARAAATVAIIPAGNSSYSVQGAGMDGVAGVQLDIAYDSLLLSGPTVTQGPLVAGALFVSNTTRTGVIKIAVVSTTPFSGSGQIASVAFASKNASAPLPTITVSMIDSKGSPISATAVRTEIEKPDQGLIATPGIPFSQPSLTTQQPVSTAPGATGTASALQSYPGIVLLPTDMLQKNSMPPVEASSPPPASPEESAPVTPVEPVLPSGTSERQAPTEVINETPHYVIYRGVADRFSTYTGSKSLSAMTALFDQAIVETITQEPKIVRSDGRQRATLTVTVPASANTSPNFAVKGGSLVAFSQDKRAIGRWLVEVLPESGTTEVNLIIFSGTTGYEYPLTVVPPVKSELTLDEPGWGRFMKEVGTVAAPLHDLNSDGVRNYLDEYMFVAHHLIKKSTPTKKTP